MSKKPHTIQNEKLFFLLSCKKNTRKSPSVVPKQFSSRPFVRFQLSDVIGYIGLG